MKIALFSDLHYPAIDERIPGLLEARAHFYQTFLQKFLAIDARLHLSLGDLTNYGMKHELEQVYSIIGDHREFIHVQGNHDNYSLTKNELLSLTGQQRYHSFETAEAVFAFLDTARELDLENWGGSLDAVQLEWFEHIIQNSEEKPLLVFAHHPVYQTTKYSDRKFCSIDPTIDIWKLLQQKRGIGMYFNGHTHVDSIVQQHQWTFIQTAACLDVPSYRLIDIQSDQITVSAMDIECDVLQKNAKMIYQNIHHFTHNPTAKGVEADRSCVVPIPSVVR